MKIPRYFHPDSELEYEPPERHVNISDKEISELLKE